MIRARLSRVAFLAAVMASTSFAPDGGSAEAPGDGADEWHRFSERCASDSLSTLSAAEASFYDGAVNIDVAGLYTVTSTDVLMPGTEGALRVIEFTADGASEEEKP